MCARNVDSTSLRRGTAQVLVRHIDPTFVYSQKGKLISEVLSTQPSQLSLVLAPRLARPQDFSSHSWDLSVPDFSFPLSNATKIGLMLLS